MLLAPLPLVFVPKGQGSHVALSVPSTQYVFGGQSVQGAKPLSLYSPGPHQSGKLFYNYNYRKNSKNWDT